MRGNVTLPLSFHAYFCVADSVSHSVIEVGKQNGCSGSIFLTQSVLQSLSSTFTSTLGILGILDVNVMLHHRQHVDFLFYI